MIKTDQIKILALDDDQSYLDMLGDFFIPRQYSYFSGNHIDCLDLIEREDINVVIVNIEMLLKEDINPIERMREINDNIKIIVLLNLWSDIDNIHIDRNMVNNILEKPSLSLRNLDQTIKGFFSNRITDKYGNNIRLLVVDDEEDVCDFVKIFFEERDLEIYTATNGVDALKVIRERNPHIVLLDVKMPKMNGMVVLKQSKKISRDIEIIMVTASDESQLKEKAFEDGAGGYIRKPVVLGELERIVFEKIKSFTG